MRFKSLLVENERYALKTVGAYIDLNPVRAGLCEDPKDYRWSGYGAAAGGCRLAQKGLRVMMERSHWKSALEGYRMTLYGVGSEVKLDGGGGFIVGEKAEAVMKSKGKLPQSVALRCRVRYFSDGAVLGSKGFEEDIFEKHKSQFGVSRKRGPSRMQGGDWNGLCVLRNLQRDVFS